MKLRIDANSLGLRLSQADLRRLSAEHRIEEVLPFPDGSRLTYVLQAAQEFNELTARFDGTAICIYLPAGRIASWTASDTVGFEVTESVAGGGEVHLLVEKDLECRHRPSETMNDRFPHPQEARRSDE